MFAGSARIHDRSSEKERRENKFIFADGGNDARNVENRPARRAAPWHLLPDARRPRGRRTIMLELTCPCCGATGAETEFHPGGEAHLVRHGPGASDDAFLDYLFHRKNPRGVHFERWRHAFGCGKWFHVARNTATLEVYGAYAADAPGPTEAILERIARRTAA
jgi:sarcosine oxidase subunit delta